jgi:hypothetical protein
MLVLIDRRWIKTISLHSDLRRRYQTSLAIDATVMFSPKRSDPHDIERNHVGWRRVWLMRLAPRFPLA